MPPLQSRLCRSVLRPLQPFEGLIGRIVRPVAHGGLAAQPFNGASDFDKVGVGHIVALGYIQQGLQRVIVIQLGQVASVEGALVLGGFELLQRKAEHILVAGIIGQHVQ